MPATSSTRTARMAAAAFVTLGLVVAGVGPAHALPPAPTVAEINNATANYWTFTGQTGNAYSPPTGNITPWGLGSFAALGLPTTVTYTTIDQASGRYINANIRAVPGVASGTVTCVIDPGPFVCIVKQSSAYVWSVTFGRVASVIPPIRVR